MGVTPSLHIHAQNALFLDCFLFQIDSMPQNPIANHVKMFLQCIMRSSTVICPTFLQKSYARTITKWDTKQFLITLTQNWFVIGFSLSLYELLAKNIYYEAVFYQFVFVLSLRKDPKLIFQCRKDRRHIIFFFFSLNLSIPHFEHC